MLQRRRCRCCVSCIIILVICISVFYFSLFSGHNYDVYKYPDFRAYAQNIGDKLGFDIDETLNIINGESVPDLNDVPLRILITDDADIPKYLSKPKKEKAITRKKSDEGTLEDKKAAPELVVQSGQGQNVTNQRDSVQKEGMYSSIGNVPKKNEVGGALKKDVTILDVKKLTVESKKSAKDSQKFQRQEELDKEALTGLERKVTNRKRTPPASVVIVTNRRSGSSFLGQIFNQNPDVFFHFEPLKVTEWKKELYPNATGLIQNILKCNFDGTPFLMEMYNHELLHRESSRVLTTPPLCNLSKIVNRLKPVNFCPQLQNDIATDVCKRYEHVVIKTIRLYNLAFLEEVVRDPKLNVKVIHLMRDPRGIYISRTKAEKKALTLGSDLDRDASYICRRMRKNLEFVKTTPSWLEGRYIRIRYEDVAANPMGWTEKLYDFTGLGKVPKEVVKWIGENTQGSSNSNAYSTQRNSALTSQAWRKATSIDVVRQMQSFCGPVLNDLGYLQVHSIEQLRNDSLSLVV